MFPVTNNVGRCCCAWRVHHAQTLQGWAKMRPVMLNASTFLLWTFNTCELSSCMAQPASNDWWHSFTHGFIAAAAHALSCIRCIVAPLTLDFHYSFYFSFEQKEYKRSDILIIWISFINIWIGYSYSCFVNNFTTLWCIYITVFHLIVEGLACLSQDTGETNLLYNLIYLKQTGYYFGFLQSASLANWDGGLPIYPPINHTAPASSCIL